MPTMVAPDRRCDLAHASTICDSSVCAQGTSSLHDVGRGRRPGRAQFVDALVELTRSEIRELDHDDELRQLLHASIEENVARLLAILGEGADPTAAPPYGAMEYARRLGSSLREVLQWC